MLKNRLFRGDFLFLPHEKTTIQTFGKNEQGRFTKPWQKTGRHE